jgi:hypothetical protein
VGARARATLRERVRTHAAACPAPPNARKPALLVGAGLVLSWFYVARPVVQLESQKRARPACAAARCRGREWR